MCVSHLYRVITNTAEAVHPPAEGANGAAPLLVPDVHCLATCCESAFTLVMVNACVHSLQQEIKQAQVLQQSIHTERSDLIITIVCQGCYQFL